jgi:hypothetical protein
MSSPGEHAQIFVCSECQARRVYGRGMFIPESKVKGVDGPAALLVCHGFHSTKINQHFVHRFVGIWIGGAVRNPEMLNI